MNKQSFSTCLQPIFRLIPDRYIQMGSTTSSSFLLKYYIYFDDPQFRKIIKIGKNEGKVTKNLHIFPVYVTEKSRLPSK